MAIIKLAAPLAGIRGTIAGITYSANGTGPYAKAWARGPNPRTQSQSTQRSFIGEIPQLWDALSASQRADWRTFAADPAQELTNSLGETYFASGYNWFTKCNIRRFRVGRSVQEDIPTQARPAAPTISDFRITTDGSDPNIAVGGTASASTSAVGHPASDAFDEDPDTNWNTSAPNTTGWVQYILPSTAIVRSYSIFNKSFNSGGPKDWTFERLDSGPTWVPVDTQTGISWSVPETKTFYFPNDTTSTTYRINITANNGDPNFLYIWDLKFFTDDNDSSIIIYPSGEFDASPDYDLVLKIAQGQTAARSVQYPGFREIIATNSVGDYFEQFQIELEDSYGVIQLNRSWFARLYRQTREGLRSSPGTFTTVTL